MSVTFYFFDRDESPAGIGDSRTLGLRSAIHDEREQTLALTLSGALPLELSEGRLVGFFDGDGEFRLFEVKRAQIIHTSGGIGAEVYLEHVLYELLGEIVPELELTGATPMTAMRMITASTRWSSAGSGNFGTKDFSSRFETALSALFRLRDLFGVRLDFRLTLEEGRITGRTVWILPAAGTDSGKRFEWSRDLIEVSREVDSSGVVTALYGKGKSRTTRDPVTGGTQTDYADFSGIAWRTGTDPAAKPLGQTYVADGDACARWGYPDGQGGRRHIFGVASFPDISDPGELLKATWEELKARREPAVRYTLRAADLERLCGFSHDAVRMGDLVHIIDDGFFPPLEVVSQVSGIRRDLLDPLDTVFTLGKSAPSAGSMLAKLEREKERLLESSGKWDEAAKNAVGEVDTSRLNGAVNLLTNRLLASGTYANVTPNENIGILLENNQADSPDYGAIYLGPGMIAIANEKDANGWRWRTFGTGAGFTADEMTTGTLDAGMVQTGRLQSANEQSWMDLDSGEFSLGAGQLSLDENGKLVAHGNLISEVNGNTVSVIGSQFGMPVISFAINNGAVGYLYAQTQDILRLESNMDVMISASDKLRFDGRKIIAPNGQECLSGSITLSGRTLYFNNGLLYRAT